MTNRPNPSFTIGETYQDREGMYKVISVEGNQLIYDYGDGIQHRGNTEIKWRIHHNMLSEKNPPQPTRPSQPLRSHDGEDFFTYDEVSPIIGDIVEAYGKSHDDYMTHEKIVVELMKHPEGQLILSRPHDRSNRYWAGVMVACFSKKFTGGSSEWNNRFDEPKKIGSAWAYRILGKKS
jgi:hypothetical protein